MSSWHGVQLIRHRNNFACLSTTDANSWVTSLLTLAVRYLWCSFRVHITGNPDSTATEFFIIVSGVRLSPLGTVATSGLLYQPQMIDDVDCGEIGGMKIGRGKPAPAPLCPPQTPHDQTRARTRAAAVGSQRLTAWAMARPQQRS
jgi:hypothetical protein